MAKELPYFRFTVQEWQNGDISMESYELKGLFIDICGFYWMKDCTVRKELLYKRFSNARAMLEQLLSNEIIKLENDGNISIEFLNEQFDLLSEKRKKRQEAGKKGGLAKSSNAKAMLKQKPSYKDKDKDKYNDKDFIKQESIFKNLQKEKDWINNLCEMYDCETNDVYGHLNTFKIHCKTNGHNKESEADAKKHFLNWIKKGNPINSSKEKSYILPLRTENRNPI
jgi:hypothetical protein